MILSFVIPLYNCEQYILRCLERISSSDVDKDKYEIVVINDGSKDGSDAETQRFKSKNTSCNLTYIVTENQGASAARNRGIGSYHLEFPCQYFYPPSLISCSLELSSLFHLQLLFFS